MKVFLINSVCGTGSTGGMVADMARLLRENGDSVRIAFGIGKSSGVPAGTAVRFNHWAGYYWHNILSRLTDHAGLYSNGQTRRLIRVIREFDPDVVHIHNLHGYYVNYELLFQFLSSAKKRVVWTLHDCWPFTGHCAHYAGIGCTGWLAGCQRCPQLRVYPVCCTAGDTAANYIRKKAAFTGLENLTVVTPSRWLADQVSRSFLKDHPIRVIPNGIDTGIFLPGEKLPAQEKTVLGVANVWDHQKGLQDIFRLRQLLPEEYRVVLVGLTRRQLTGLPENVTGIGRTEDKSELARLYRAADVFVNPTYQETFGLTTVEAQACGTPAVVYHVGGCPETVQPGCGQTVAAGDVEALAEAVRGWCGRTDPLPVDRDALSSRRCCEAYYALYRELIQGC